MSLKSSIAALPLLGRMVRRPFIGSAAYWEHRYRNGGNSGAGSHGRLARFKADVVNEFVKTHKVKSVLEFGCGDGAQLEHSDYPEYVGVDVSKAALALARKRLAGRPNYRVVHQSQALRLRAELTLSLDVICYLVEDEVFNAYMQRLFAQADRFVIIYSSDFSRKTAPHVRHRKFTHLVERNVPGSKLLRTVENPYPFDPADPENTSRARFYIYDVGPAAA